MRTRISLYLNMGLDEGSSPLVLCSRSLFLIQRFFTPIILGLTIVMG